MDQPELFRGDPSAAARGRFFNDGEWGQNEAVLSERTAKTLWPGEDPVGQQFQRAGAEGEAPFTVVGVVADARTVTLDKPDPMLIYVPYWFRADANGGIVVRTRQAPGAMAESIRKAIWSVDAGVAVPEVRAAERTGCGLGGRIDASRWICCWCSR